ncbi:MAG TPA: hypothetical protein VF252_11615 [Gemmatimonadales bacterium]
MRISVSGGQAPRGITVLGLLLLILALVALGFFVVRYLDNQQAGGPPPITLLPPQAPSSLSASSA